MVIFFYFNLCGPMCSSLDFALSHIAISVTFWLIVQFCFYLHEFKYFLFCISSEQSEQNCWKPTVCMNFCCDFLSFVKQTATEDNPGWVALKDHTVQHLFQAPCVHKSCLLPSSVVYLFSFEPHRDVTYSIHRDSQYSFLPHWYVDEITRSQASHH